MIQINSLKMIKKMHSNKFIKNDKKKCIQINSLKMIKKMHSNKFIKNDKKNAFK